MKQYLELLEKVYTQGENKEDRTGTGTISLFGEQLKFNLEEGFPLVTTKKIITKSMVHELLWFIRGDSDIGYLLNNDVHIWDNWADQHGYVGPLYGHQWRHWGSRGNDGIDQLQIAIDTINKNPDCRRIIVSAWNVEDLDEMALHPCHCFFQLYVNNSKLSCQVYLRSLDMFLGCPFDIGIYALLTHMIARECGLRVGKLILSIGDCHIYRNHFEQVELQLSREPYPLPGLWLNPKCNKVTEFTYSDIDFLNYKYHPRITGDISV